MSTLLKCNNVLIQTRTGQFYFNADQYLMNFLKKATPQDTRILSNYFGLPIPDGDFYVGYTIIAPQKN